MEEVVKKRMISLPEVREILSKQDIESMDQIQRWTHDYVSKFSKIEPKVAKKMKPGGIFHMATDWQHYAEQMLEVMEASKDYVNSCGAGAYAPRPDYRPVTKFEQRGLRLGHGVWDLIYQKKGWQ